MPGSTLSLRLLTHLVPHDDLGGRCHCSIHGGAEGGKQPVATQPVGISWDWTWVVWSWNPCPGSLCHRLSPAMEQVGTWWMEQLSWTGEEGDREDLSRGDLGQGSPLQGCPLLRDWSG